MIARSVQGKLLVLAVFIVGIATGVFSANLYRSRVVQPAKAAENRPEDHASPQDRARQGFERMANYLGLDQTQRAQIQKITEETRNQFRDLREKTEPQFKAIEESSRDKVMAVLNEDQRRKYTEFRETHPGPGGPRGRGPRPPDKDNDNKR
jgi:hypothetical protein